MLAAGSTRAVHHDRSRPPVPLSPFRASKRSSRTVSASWRFRVRFAGGTDRRMLMNSQKPRVSTGRNAY